MTEPTMTIKRFVVGPLQTNCFLIVDYETDECAIIDPGGDTQELEEYIGDNNLKVSSIINTHGHHDHIHNNWHLAAKFDVPVYIHKDDASMLRSATDDIGIYFNENPRELYPELSMDIRELIDKEKILVGKQKIKVYHTPGHTPGSICLSIDGHLITGDLLFKQGIGRTDLPGGSSTEIMVSLKRLFDLFPEMTFVYPGHGEITSLGCEKNDNPWIKLVMER